MEKSKIRTLIHNRFDIEVVDANTGKIKQKARAFNVVCNSLWNYLLNSTTPFGGYIHYGTGTGTPSPTNTSLFTYLGGGAATTTSRKFDFEHGVITRVARFTIGLSEAVGATLTEIGLAAGTGSSTLTTHAMLQDMNGNQITITKTDTEYINIYASVYCHWDTTNDDFKFVSFQAYYNNKYGLADWLTGADNSFLNRQRFYFGPTNIIVYNSGYVNYDVLATKAVNVGTKTIVFTAPRVLDPNANYGGIRFIGFIASGSSENCAGIMRKIETPTQITGEVIGTGDGTTTDFKTKFNLPYDATILVNGVEVNPSDITVKHTSSNNFMLMLRVDAGRSTANNIVYYSSIDARNDSVFENELYDEGFGPETYKHSTSERYGSHYSGSLEGSNDLQTWTMINQYIGHETVYDIPAAHQHYKFYRIGHNLVGNEYGYVYNPWFNYNKSGKNVIFNTAPASGSVISANYKFKGIPKDTDHVLDASITFTFGEWTGE